MFLRRKTKSARGVGYSYWHLCRTVRTARGPRQQVVASLGKLDDAQLAGLRGGWDDLPALLRGETPIPKPDTAPLPGLGLPGQTEGDTAPRWEPADLRALRVERSRDFGECYLACERRAGKRLFLAVRNALLLRWIFFPLKRVILFFRGWVFFPVRLGI
ncbi:MAG: hypothetical protein H2172_13375 [Opitutus sp.]|nr:hypothetical protein [Opitutus sp.]MCS6275750.1 hypothetical protein [Opitutus sp.]MCS6300846.1 hypothetical protein [Opitutus sp.]